MIKLSLKLIDLYGEDSLRYYLMRNMALGQDANYNLDKFIKRYNSDLANDYGNVVNRVIILISKFFDSKVPSPGDYNSIDLHLIAKFKETPVKVYKFIEELRIHDATEMIFSMVKSINKYF